MMLWRTVWDNVELSCGTRLAIDNLNFARTSFKCALSDRRKHSHQRRNRRCFVLISRIATLHGNVYSSASEN